MPFSTIVGSTITSPTRQNYDLTITGNSTVALAYSNANITDKVGLQVVIYNNSGSTITLTAGTQFNNYTTYPQYCTVLNQVQILAHESITLQTTVVGQDYTIVAISAMVNLDGGTAGALAYQSAAGNTTFLAPGTANYILESNGVGQPPRWNILTTGNLAGGVAGALDYQSAPNVTSKSAAGNTFVAGGGGLASMLSSTTAGWTQTSWLASGNANTYSSGTLTLNGPRGYLIALSAIGGSSGNLSTYLTSINVPAVDGNRFIIWNDTGANYNLTIGNCQNPTAFNMGGANTSFLQGSAGSQYLTIRRKETVVLQRYNSTAYSIESTTQSIGIAGSWGLNPQASANFTIAGPIYDPNGWGVTGQTKIIPTVKGNYLIVMYQNASFIGGTIGVIKNTGGTGNVLSAMNGYVNSGGNGTTILCGILAMNGSTDYIQASGASTSTQAHIAIILLN